MTIRSFLEEIYTMDHADEARYPDGSGGADNYTLAISIDGHGKLLNAKVKSVSVGRGFMGIHAKGEKG